MGKILSKVRKNSKEKSEKTTIEDLFILHTNLGGLMHIFYNGSSIELPEGSLCKDLAEKYNLREPHQALAACVNGINRDLSTPLSDGDHITFWNFEDKEGKEIFWHTSAHLLAQAILRLFPDAKPTIGPPIENGFFYDFANLTITEADFERIEQEVEKIVKENPKPERTLFNNREEALKCFAHNPYKCELISGFAEGSPMTAYAQGEFFDLCRGPHLAAIGKVKAFKVMKTSGAYWKGDPSREMLTRVYAISFPDRKSLQQYLTLLEEAKKRDHKTIGPKLDLFSIMEQAPGMPFIHAKGMIVWNQLIAFWRELHKEADYIEIKTPQLMSRDLWEMSGHWKHYRENMYTFGIEDREFALKPMNCPGCMLYFRSQQHSYRELPLRIAELGHVHRHEASGALNGLFRVRSFHQDDAHLFMRPQEIKQEILNVLELVEKTYSVFGLPYRLELSTRPEKSIGTDEEWTVATAGLKDALDEWGEPYQINEGDGAFYGPKIDIHIRDALDRSWQCGTVQLDMALPEKFSLEYRDSDGTAKRPVMVHRAIFGSVERFFGILIEHFVGKFPLWLAPVQVRIITIADRHAEYAREVAKKLEDGGLRVEVDDSSESVSKKIRNAQMMQINYMLTVGDQEIQNGTVTLRSRNNQVYEAMQVNDLIPVFQEEVRSRDLLSHISDVAKAQGSHGPSHSN